jgi:hypothetical protein
LVNTKSTPDTKLNDEHKIASLPDTVKPIEADVAEAEVTPKVTTGEVESLAGEPDEDSEAGPLPFELTARIRIS